MESVKGAERGKAFRMGVSLLAEAGIDNPALEASVLLGYVTGEEAATVLMGRRQTLNGSEKALYETLIERRCRHETLSRLTGRKEFYSRDYHVNKDVLDPRPETEILVEEALHCLKSFPGRRNILDVGTGSGVIAVTLAAEHRDAVVTATDISTEALKTAVCNAAMHGVSDRVRFIRADLAECFADTSLFDLVVSNPPYVSMADYRTLPPEVRSQDPAVALLGGPDGTRFYPALAEIASRLLNPRGHLLVEVGAGQDRLVKHLFQDAGLVDLEVFQDLSGISRVIKGTRPHG